MCELTVMKPIGLALAAQAEKSDATKSLTQQAQGLTQVITVRRLNPAA